MTRSTSPRAFGIEEEYQILDPEQGTPQCLAAEVILGMPEAVRSRASREYLSSELETSTPICHDAAEAEAALTEFRDAAASACMASGALLAGTGLPPDGGEIVGTVTPKPRYLHIEAEMRHAGRHQYATGTHVHVEVPSQDAGVEVVARIAQWSPTLVALTANSPFWCGVPTGFASWRHLMARNWPAAGYPDFENSADYARTVADLIATGVVPDAGMLSWAIRLSANYPTVELRIADTQLSAGDTVAFAAIVRALVDRALSDAERGIDRPRYGAGMVEGGNWMAARDGLGSDLIDPLRAERLPAFELVDRMLGTVEARLREYGDHGRVDAYLRALLERGEPAAQQLTAFTASEIDGVLKLYRERFCARSA